MAANIPRESDEGLTRSAVHTMTLWLTENLPLDENLLAELFSSQVISLVQRDKLRAHKKADGCSHAVGTLVNLVLMSEVRVNELMDVLEKTLPWIYDAIKDGETKLKSGEWVVPGQLDVKVLQDHLKDNYKEYLSHLQPVPGEEFSVDMNDQCKMMTPDFSAEKVDLESRKVRKYISTFQKLDDNNVVYNTLSVSELEGVFDHVVDDIKVNNLQPNLVTLIGDPGVGKTTAAQNMAWGWATGKSSLSDRLKLVYSIPIRKVKQGSIVEVLSDLKLLPPSLEQEQSQNLSKYAKDILFILDGADEADITEGMMDLITGKVFCGSSVLLTARPEAKCLQSLTVWPRVKVSLSGTDQITVDKYLKDAVSGSTDQEWTDFQGKYQEKLTDKSLLLVPLYLTLLCGVLKVHIAKDLKFSQFRIPETMTQLFNVFMHVIIVRWLRRVSPNIEPNVRFSNSPLGLDSSVPGHIKSRLSNMGKLSYMDLIKPSSNYEFTETQGSKCLLDMKDIEDSGLFTLGTSGSKTIFFLKHKQLQEYLAAIYLAYTGTEDYFIQRLLCSEENKGKCLADVIRHVNLIKVIQFTCGLSATFFTSLLTSAASHFTIMKSYDEQIDVYYEAALFCEQNPGDSQTGYDQLTQYLTQCTPKQGGEFNFLLTKTGNLSFYQNCLHKLTALFDVHVSVRLLSNLYNIHLIPVSSVQGHTYKLHTEGGVSSPGSNDNRLCLDQLQAELLSAVCISGVHFISAGDLYSTVYVDIPGLLGTFTDIQKLDVEGRPYIPYTSTVRSHRVYSTTSTRV